MREVAEETGLCLSADSLVPYGYERFLTPPVDNFRAVGEDLLTFICREPHRQRFLCQPLDATDRRWNAAGTRLPIGRVPWWPG